MKALWSPTVAFGGAHRVLLGEGEKVGVEIWQDLIPGLVPKWNWATGNYFCFPIVPSWLNFVLNVLQVHFATAFKYVCTSVISRCRKSGKAHLCIFLRGELIKITPLKTSPYPGEHFFQFLANKNLIMFEVSGLLLLVSVIQKTEIKHICNSETKKERNTFKIPLLHAEILSCWFCPLVKKGLLLNQLLLLLLLLLFNAWVLCF